MRRMWRHLGGILSAGAQHYLDEVETAVARGDAVMIAAWASCPYEPIYRARGALELADVSIPDGDEFHWDLHQDRLVLRRRFDRTDDWETCMEGDSRPRRSSC